MREALATSQTTARIAADNKTARLGNGIFESEVMLIG